MNKFQHELKTVFAQIVNGFVAGDIGGNPAGVVLNADGFEEQDMLQIAAKIGFSETAFVSKSENSTFKLDFFTPTRRIAHCGHATIATFSYLAEQGLVAEGPSTKETVDGQRKIMIKNGAAFMEQLAPKYREVDPWREKIVHSLGLNDCDLDDRLPVLHVNTGNSFVVIGVQDAAVLQNLKPDFQAITEISEELDLIGYYGFTTDTQETMQDATTRMFAPRYGIEEEAATGMAAGPLACVLYDYLNVVKDQMVIAQGHFMTQPSPSLITVELDICEGRIQGLMAGGYGKVMKTLEIELE